MTWSSPPQMSLPAGGLGREDMTTPVECAARFGFLRVLKILLAADEAPKGPIFLGEVTDTCFKNGLRCEFDVLEHAKLYLFIPNLDG